MEPGRQRWLGPIVLAGALYAVASIGSSALAAAAASNRELLLWRWAALAACAVVFGSHVAYEHFRLRHRARPAAWHVSLAVALGAFAIALAANLHDLSSASGYRPRMLVALVAWPLLTALPAYVVAWVVAAGLGMAGRRE